MYWEDYKLNNNDDKSYEIIDKFDNGSSDEIEKLIELLKRKTTIRQYIIISYILILVIIGLFLLKYFKNKLESILNEIDFYKKNLKNNLEKYSLYIKNEYNKFIREDTYLIYNVRTNFFSKCKYFLNKIENLERKKEDLNEEIVNFIDKYKKDISKIYYDIQSFNQRFVERKKIEYEYLFKQCPIPLDDNQKTAIITDDKHNMVVAGAGSGKTEVLINRIAYLIERKPDTIKQNRILALAFQNKAAEEMKERLKERYNLEVEIRTFHSLGNNILRKIGGRYNLFGSDKKNIEIETKNLIKKLVTRAKKEPIFQNDLIEYMQWVGSSEKEVEDADFETKEEFYNHMKNLELISLNGRTVKSFGELKIMNFFLTHKINDTFIKINYEDYAEWMGYKDENDLFQTPKPDFYLPEYDIYIEHWSIDENGDVPKWYNQEKYLKTMEIKKEKFKENNKTLVETTYGEFISKSNFLELLHDRIIKALKEKYPEEDFIFSKISYKELVEKVWEDCKSYIEVLPDHIYNYIRNAKTYRLTPEKIKKRLKEERWTQEQKSFSKVAIKIYEEYNKELENLGCIDFEDMINKSTDYLKENKDFYQNKFDHILIDEYQDISQQRYELIKTLMDKNNNCKLFCVGDDWQSIMGFSGSDLDFFKNFQNYFDHPSRTDLTYNYRSIKTIVEAGNSVIENNKDLQLDKKVIAKNQDVKPIRIYSFLHQKNYKKQYFIQMADHCKGMINDYLSNGYSTDDFMILTRIYKNPYLKESFNDYAKMKKLDYISVHKSKGLQSKVVFILDVKEGLYGFPCQLHTPIIFEPATIKKDSNKEAEERRLFYVALTRAKEEVIIYSQKCLESKFLRELGQNVIIEDLPY